MWYIVFSVLVVLQTPGFSAVRRKSSAPRPHPYLASPARRPATKAAPSTPAMAGSVSGQMDARELRDEVLHMKKEMNGMRKERDLAKAQQVCAYVRSTDHLSYMHTCVCGRTWGVWNLLVTHWKTDNVW